MQCCNCKAVLTREEADEGVAYLEEIDRLDMADEAICEPCARMLASVPCDDDEPPTPEKGARS